MPHVLIYSPDVLGHPRVYCRVIADALMGLPVRISIALGFTDEVGLKDSPDLWPLEARDGVQLIDTRGHSATGAPHLTAEELVRLQETVGATTTLFIEADKSVAEFRRIAENAAPRFHGRTLAIFANTAEWHPGEDSFTGERLTLRGRTMRRTLGNLKRAVFDRRNTMKYFYEKTIIGAGLFSEIFVKDERLAEWRGPPVRWMPEISRPPTAPESTTDVVELARRRADLKAFLARNEGREPMLYFGDAAFYKGYDLFLKFLAENDYVCGLHPGRLQYRPTDVANFEHDVEALRRQLHAEGRLFETDAYVHSQGIKELFFRAIRLYVTTHRLALSSSTMIQAAEFGLPVLVPDRGLLGHRVRTYGIGDVYRYGDLVELREKADALWRSDLSRFRTPVEAFWRRFDDDAIRDFFRVTLAPDAAQIGTETR